MSRRPTSERMGHPVTAALDITPEEAARLRLTDLIPLEELQAIQEAFARATGVASVITAVDGSPITTPSNFCRLCLRIIRGTEKGRANCYRSDAILGRHHPGGPVMQHCLSGGLWDAGTSISVAGHHIANWLIGQVLEEPVDEERMLAYAREIGADEDEFRTALAEVTRMPRSQFEQVAQALYLIATQLSRSAFQSHLQARFIEERERADEALRASEARIRCYFENAPDAIVVVDADARILDCNPRAAALFGVPVEGMIGAPLAALLPPDQVEQGLAGHRELVRLGAVDGAEFRVDRADGRSVDVEWTGARLDADRYIGFLKDVTGRKAVEAELRHAQRMESVGRLAGGVAHDFNNMLGVIIGHAEFALSGLAPGDPLRHNLTEIQAAGERSAGLARQLLAFARRQTASPQTLDLNDRLGALQDMLRRLVGENVDVSWAPCAGLWPVRMDPSQIDQIVTNLVVNARDAIADIGSIAIEVANVNADPTFCGTRVGMTPGAYVEIRVRDTGAGMAAETLAHAFEPFFTTKEPGKGTGLGLATVYGIVRQNEGYIEATSEEGVGTEFRVYLPRALREGVGEEGESAAAPEPAGGEVVLVVEDEVAILSLVTALLTRQGYTVLAARSPSEAIEKTRAAAGAIDLVLSDVVMPTMNGRDLRERLTRIAPRIRYLFMSGYPADVVAHHGVVEDGVHLLQKPFSSKSLAEAVRAALDEA